ncbi:hypothetical protein OF83DRAFT_1179743 [Amylostereum chailletii]|nr:hypothetical protein OF83DRAFT_1179743 [Amylostereum chailletii]
MVPPSLRTLEVNINAVFYTCHLGVHCIQRNRAPDDLKAVILIGSMASWQAVPRAEEYTASKHAMLGLMRALDKTLGALSIRVGILALVGIPLASVPRIARAVFAAALDPDPATRGLPWTVPDDGPVFLLDREYLREGVYALMDARVARLQRLGEGVRRTVAVIRDVAGYLGLEGGIAMMGLVLAFGAVILGTMDGVQ